MESRIRLLERGFNGQTIKLTGNKTNRTAEKYNSSNGKAAGVFNQDSEVQLTKKKVHRPAEVEDDEEEVPVKKTKKKKVAKDSDDE